MTSLESLGYFDVRLPVVKDAENFFVDAWQRSILFLDVLRKRGNNYLEHRRANKPPVLAFDYEVLLDARQFDANPVNFALARILPDEGTRTHPLKRPIVVIDPRAGHGPGIGGSKKNSEVGMALKGGHPTYFILFYPQPMPGQTIADIERAEAIFLEEVQRRHPEAGRPAIIGNCQAGWSAAMLGADRPDVAGPMILSGAPMSYWAGLEGYNAMRYRGGLSGGVWIASFMSDIGDGKFDGAWLVSNFEDLNPANTYWKKEYNLYAKVDTEEQRYLDFERWWGGFYHMCADEIHFIVKNLFVGNELHKGTLELEEGRPINLAALDDPVVVFSSKGDNITPPQQALNWIEDVYGSVAEIKRQQKVIIYLLHKQIGHLGIFVSGSVAKKEHQEIIGSLEHVDLLPPGLYEMVIDDNRGSRGYGVRFEERRINDIRALDDGRQDEEVFSAIAEVSDQIDHFYINWVRPFVRTLINSTTAEVIRQLHPLRVSRYVFSDLNPFMLPVKTLAPHMKHSRVQVSEDNPFWALQNSASKLLADSLDFYRDQRDQNIELGVKLLYSDLMLGSFFSDKAKRKDELTGKKKEQTAEVKKKQSEDLARWRAQVNNGGYLEGIMRTIVLVARADHAVDRQEIIEACQILGNHSRADRLDPKEYKRLITEQSLILEADRERAIKALTRLLRSKKQRREALDVAQRIADADGVFVDEERAVIHRLESVFKLEKSDSSRKRK